MVTGTQTDLGWVVEMMYAPAPCKQEGTYFIAGKEFKTKKDKAIFRITQQSYF